MWLGRHACTPHKQGAAVSQAGSAEEDYYRYRRRTAGGAVEREVLSHTPLYSPLTGGVYRWWRSRARGTHYSLLTTYWRRTAGGAVEREVLTTLYSPLTGGVPLVAQWSERYSHYSLLATYWRCTAGCA
eukprot:6194043-Prymnesium_polylepis.1